MLSKLVKSIESQVMDALKLEKKDKVFLCNNIAQITSEIFVISSRQIFDIKKPRSSFKSRKKIRLPLTTWNKYPRLFWFCVFLRRPSPQLPTLDMILAECKQSLVWKVSKYGVFSGPYFLAFGLNTEIYGVNYKRRNKKMHVNFNSNFIKNKTFCTGVFLWILRKGDSGARVFLWIFQFFYRIFA